jgi:hypothetical protein
VLRIIVTAVQARMDFSASLLMESALRLVLHSADHNVSIVIGEHELAVHIKLQHS